MTIAFENISPLFDYLDKNKDAYYFRGYKKIDELKPKLGRNRGFSQNEYNIFNEFSNVQEVKDLKINTLRSLFELGQHYGIPTRLLDWSLDPFVALYFALGKEENFDNQPVFLACLEKNDPQFPDVSDIFDKDIFLSDIDPCLEIDLNNSSISEIETFGMETEHPNITEYQHLPFFWKKYEEYVSGIKNFIYFKYKKDFINRRKEAQQGIFSFHKSVDELFPQESYKKIEVRFNVNQKKDTLEKLKNMGIEQRNLFPDYGIYKKIDQGCKRINKKYSVTNKLGYGR